MTVNDTALAAPRASQPLSRSGAYVVLAALVLIWGVILWLGKPLPLSLILGGVLILLGVAAIAIADTRRR